MTTKIFAQSDFEMNQLKFERVKELYDLNSDLFKKEILKKGFDFNARIFIRVFKYEKELQIFIEKNNKFELYKTFKICAASGILGPKNAQGDKQVPEGFYFINVFNPMSLYHLSLGINYPNKADEFRSAAADKGGDIYIHGECASIGCMAMADGIKEIYFLAIKARHNGRNEIPVHIFPFKFSEKNKPIFAKKEFLKMNGFWKNLEQGFLYFNRTKKIPIVTVNSKGIYLFK